MPKPKLVVTSYNDLINQINESLDNPRAFRALLDVISAETDIVNIILSDQLLMDNLFAYPSSIRPAILISVFTKAKNSPLYSELIAYHYVKFPVYRSANFKIDEHSEYESKLLLKLLEDNLLNWKILSEWMRHALLRRRNFIPIYTLATKAMHLIKSKKTHFSDHSEEEISSLKVMMQTFAALEFQLRFVGKHTSISILDNALEAWFEAGSAQIMLCKIIAAEWAELPDCEEELKTLDYCLSLLDKRQPNLAKIQKLPPSIGSRFLDKYKIRTPNPKPLIFNDLTLSALRTMPEKTKIRYKNESVVSVLTHIKVPTAPDLREIIAAFDVEVALVFREWRQYLTYLSREKTTSLYELLANIEAIALAVSQRLTQPYRDFSPSEALIMKKSHIVEASDMRLTLPEIIYRVQLSTKKWNHAVNRLAYAISEIHRDPSVYVLYRERLLHLLQELSQSYLHFDDYSKILPLTEIFPQLEKVGSSVFYFDKSSSDIDLRLIYDAVEYDLSKVMENTCKKLVTAGYAIVYIKYIYYSSACFIRFSKSHSDGSSSLYDLSVYPQQSFYNDPLKGAKERLVSQAMACVKLKSGRVLMPHEDMYNVLHGVFDCVARAYFSDYQLSFIIRAWVKFIFAIQSGAMSLGDNFSPIYEQLVDAHLNVADESQRLIKILQGLSEKSGSNRPAHYKAAYSALALARVSLAPFKGRASSSSSSALSDNPDSIASNISPKSIGREDPQELTPC